MVRVRKFYPFPGDKDVDLSGWLARLSLPEKEHADVQRACELVADVRHLPGNPDYLWSDTTDCYRVGLEMADILVELGLEPQTLLAAILYRAVREEKLPLKTVELEFGKPTARLVQGVTEMEAIGNALHPTTETVLGQSQSQVDNIRRMLVTMIDDVRVALIKLAERNCALHALKDEPVKRWQVAREVSEVYAPLAHRLGIGHIKWELEDLAFRYLEPQAYKQIATLLDGRRLDRQQFIDSVREELTQRLSSTGLDAEVNGRVKHIFSIWKKMQRKNIPFSEIYDIRAVRILVDSLPECYAALGVVHTAWRNLPNEFDDYIANPKSNGYQSLHTAVIGPGGKALEVQIRTHKMHQESEFGVCAHWAYKGADTTKGSSASYDDKIAWLRQVLEWHEELGDVDGLADLASEVSQDRIYVFTPEGHVVDLPRGSTPVDFAYHVHTEVGHRCRGARVDRRIVPLTFQLITGQQVEILTGKDAQPSRDWLRVDLGYSRSSRTRSKIQQWFRLQAREENVDAGAAIVEREFKRLALTSLDFKLVANKLKRPTVDDMYAAVGSGEISSAQVLAAAQRMFEKAEAKQLDFAGFTPPSRERPSAGIVVHGVGNLLTAVAGCCNPVPGDEIIGYITHGRGITVHRRDCGKFSSLHEREPERAVEVEWGDSPARFPAVIAVQANDRPSLLHDVTSLLAQDRINVTGLNTVTHPEDGSVNMQVTVEVSGLSALSRLCGRLTELPNVVSVERLRDD
ncbi:MAG: GTP diphosphokinase [Pseudomonadales bacterium]